MSLACYEQASEYVPTSAPKAKAKFGTRLSKLFGGGKPTSEPPRHFHHEYGKVRYICYIYCPCFYYSCILSITSLSPKLSNTHV